MSLSVPSTIPWSARMNCQLRIRITNETKNGSRRSSSSADLCRPPRNAIQYATGYMTTSAIAVDAIP